MMTLVQEETQSGPLRCAFQNSTSCGAQHPHTMLYLKAIRSRELSVSDKLDQTSLKADKPPASAPRRPLSPAAQRALAEAAERRAEADRHAAEQAKARPRELQGPKGPEPTRYGDWENKGIASDF